MSTIKVTQDNFESEVKQAKGIIVVDFYADWCGPCQMQGPILEEFSDEVKEVKVCKINIDENPDLASQYSIMTIPTIMVLKDGEITYKEPGVLQKNQLHDLVK